MPGKAVPRAHAFLVHIKRPQKSHERGYVAFDARLFPVQLVKAAAVLALRGLKSRELFFFFRHFLCQKINTFFQLRQVRVQGPFPGRELFEAFPALSGFSLFGFNGFADLLFFFPRRGRRADMRALGAERKAEEEKKSFTAHVPKNREADILRIADCFFCTIPCKRAQLGHGIH